MYYFFHTMKNNLLFLLFLFLLVVNCNLVEEELVDMYYTSTTSGFDTLYYTAYDCAISISGCDSDSLAVDAKVRVDKNEDNSNIQYSLKEKRPRAGELKLQAGKESVDQLPIEKEVLIKCSNTLDLNVTLVGSLNISGMNSFQTITSVQLIHLYNNYDYKIETTKGCSLFVFGRTLNLWECPKRVYVRLTRPGPDFRGIYICSQGNVKNACDGYCKALPACSAFVEIPKGYSCHGFAG